MLYQQHVSKGMENLAKGVIPRLPRVMELVVTVTPHRVQQIALARSLNYALRANIAANELDFFNNKVLNICIKDIDAKFSIRYVNRRLLVGEATPNPDLSFSATGYDLVLIATQRLDPDMLFFQRRLEMNGDTALGLGIKNLLASIELDEQFNPSIAEALQRFAVLIERYRQ